MVTSSDVAARAALAAMPIPGATSAAAAIRPSSIRFTVLMVCPPFLAVLCEPSAGSAAVPRTAGGQGQRAARDLNGRSSGDGAAGTTPEYGGARGARSATDAAAGANR